MCLANFHFARPLPQHQFMLSAWGEMQRLSHVTCKMSHKTKHSTPQLFQLVVILLSIGGMHVPIYIHVYMCSMFVW